MAQPRRKASKDEGKLEGVRVLVVEARYYDEIADLLLAGAASVLEGAGVAFDRVTVPGALEIPPAIAIALAEADRHGRPYDAAVALGCVIRGDTTHFEIVSHQSARGLMELSIAQRFPIGNGIITVDTEAQAWERARVEEQDKGGDAARAALALIGIKQRFGKR